MTTNFFTAPLFTEVEWDSDADDSSKGHDYSVILDIFRELTKMLNPEFMARIESEPRIRKWLEGQKQVPQ